MDARRFDTFARGIARVGGTRRSMLRALALAVGGTVAATGSARALDAAPDGVGSSGQTTCPPSRRPTKQVAGIPPFPAFLVGGTCSDLDERTSYNLIDAGAEEAGDAPKGSKSATRVARSMTSIRVKIDDLLAKPHALVVRAGGTSDEMIACGDVGGVITNNSIAFGLRERNGSGYAGVAYLTTVNDQTKVDVLVAQDLFELVDSWEGQTVVTTIDVNLREKPSESSKVIAVLGEGVVLTVTGPAEGAWLPVENAATGDTGYVNANYVEPQ